MSQDQIIALIQRIADPKFLYDPLFPLVAGAIVTLLIAVFSYLLFSGPQRRSHRNAAAELDDLTAKLAEAERIAKFGTFAWDFENPSASFWSDGVYTLHGLKMRRSTPNVDLILTMTYESDRAAASKQWNDAKTKPGEFDFSYRSVAADKQLRYLRVQGTTTLGSDKKARLVRGVVHDVTREVEIDRAKSEFVSLASHQLKTPLTSILWLTEALQKNIATYAAVDADYINKIHVASERMRDMVNDLLNVSRIELDTISVQPELINVKDFIASTIDEQAPTAQERRIDVQLEVTEAFQITADKNLVRMIFQNLISNAIKYSLPGGRVLCKIEQAGASREMLFVSVSDSGIGIPKDEQSRVFEKLHRASNAEKSVPDGSGLGLYVIKTILEHVGGGITFESTEGKGSTFYVSLPMQWRSSRVSTQAR